MQLKRGLLLSFDAGSYRAELQLAGSLGTALKGIAVARNIDAAEMVIGRKVALLVFDAANPNDMLICAVWE